MLVLYIMRAPVYAMIMTTVAAFQSPSLPDTQSDHFRVNRTPAKNFFCKSREDLSLVMAAHEIGCGEPDLAVRPSMKLYSSSSLAQSMLPFIDESDAWEVTFKLQNYPYMSSTIMKLAKAGRHLKVAGIFTDLVKGADDDDFDPLWYQIKLEAKEAVKTEADAGPALYTGILSKPDLVAAVVEHVSNIFASNNAGFARHVMQPTSIRNLFMSELTAEDRRAIAFDIMACAVRSPSVGDALNALLFNTGFHALVCYRLSHRLFLQGRTGIAHFFQSVVSSRFSMDIHPGAKIGAGIYLAAGAGVVIGETAVIGDDCSILQGVTLGGTGKVRGDRHPKLGRGVVVQDSAAILGNINIGDGSVVTAKSIVLKDVPPLARVSGVPAKVKSYRSSVDNEFAGEMDRSQDWADWFHLLDMGEDDTETLKDNVAKAYATWADKIK